MTTSALLKKWTPLILPFLLFCGLLVIFQVCPSTADWSSSGSLQYLPYILFGIGGILGMIFTQSRISFICLLFAFLTVLLHYYFFVSGKVDRGSAVIFLSAIYVPPLTAIFHRLSEGGLWTAQAAYRALIILSAVLVILLLPLIPELSGAILNAQSVLCQPTSAGLNIRISLLGTLAFIISLPFLIVRKQHESPFLGKMLGLAVLFVFGALNLDIHNIQDRQSEAMLLVFMSGSAVTLIGAILEGSWRSANIDELTELPTRRVLKHHLASLGPSYAIAMLDIDFFKRINDKYGHDTGDQVLRFIAAHLNANRGGVAYRYGGEEFVIVCENDNFEKTVESMELLRRTINSRKFWIRSKTRPRKKPDSAHLPEKNNRGESITVTISIGVAKKDGRYVSPQEVLEAADKALYRAKKEGRDRVKAG